MEAIINFLNEYGILSAIITAIAGALGVLAKTIYNKTIGDKMKEDTKKDVASLVVKYVEQVYKDIHGEEKLNKALEAFADMLNNKGITISDLEMRVYLESALAEFNKAFNKEQSNKEQSVKDAVKAGIDESLKQLNEAMTKTEVTLEGAEG